MEQKVPKKEGSRKQKKRRGVFLELEVKVRPLSS